MSLAVAKDSGFYVVDMKKGENYEWGKNEGCDMFKVTCSSDGISEYCKAYGEVGCNDNHMYRTFCDKNQYNMTCPIEIHAENCKEMRTSEISQFTYGKDSVCLLTEVK